MKKLIFLATIAITVVASCAKDPLSKEDAPKSGMVKYTATVSFENTKAYLDGLKVVWEEGDKVAIFDDVNAEANEFTVTAVSAGSATISGEIAQGANTLWGVYPFSAAVKTVEDDTLFVTVPAVQEIPAGKNIAKDAIVSVAKAAVGTNLGFKNVVSLVKFNLPKENVNKVVFSSLDGSVGVTGAMGAIIDDGEIDVKLSGKTSLTVTKADGFAQGSDYYAAVFAQDVTGIKFVFTSTSSKYLVSSDKYAVFALNGGLNFAFTDKQLDDGAFPLNIATKEDLDSFAAHATLYDAGEWVKLTADIDYDAQWTAVANFVGNFDGGNHSIYGSKNGLKFAANTTYPEYLGFFSKIYGSEVKDLKLGYNPETGAADGSEISVSSIMTNVGPLAGTIANGRNTNVAKVSNVSSYVNISFIYTSSVTGKNVFYGGIVGSIGRNETIIENSNSYCPIASTATGNTARYDGEYIGGITGSVQANDVVIQDCINYGKITPTAKRSTAGPSFYGGIIGRYGKGTTRNSILRCKNLCTDEMQSNGQIGQQQFLGGILGASNGKVSTEEGVYDLIIEDCENLCPCFFSNLSANVAAAGMVSMVQCNFKISGCTNGQSGTEYGKMSHGTANVNKISACAGMLGCIYATATGVIENCTNYAPMTYGLTTKSTLAGAAGILGAAQEGGFAAISNCKNYGNVSFGFSVADIPAGAGGIIGANASNCTIENCENYGNVTASGTGNLNAAGGLVGYQAAVDQTGAGCKVDCVVSSANGGGIIVGNNVGASTWGTSTSKVKVAGSVNGTTLVSSNYTDYLYAGKGTTTCNAEFWVK